MVLAGIIVKPPLVNATLKALPLQISLVWFPITGFAFTETTTLNGFPIQLPAAPDFGKMMASPEFQKLSISGDFGKMLASPDFGKAAGFGDF